MELLWDPLRKKNVAATPEERVRQWFIGVLGDTLGIPLHLMMSEAGFTFGRKRYRADIVVFGRNGLPSAIVECKRPDVDLTEDVALQAMRYNAVLSVKVIILTNGKRTLVYKKEGTRFAPCDHVPTFEEIERSV